jgi:hypothetical protein
MVFNATFNNMSVILLQALLLLEETAENHWPVVSHWQTLSHNVEHLALIEIQDTALILYNICCIWLWSEINHTFLLRGRRCGDRIVVWYTTTYAISAYHHWCCELESRSGPPLYTMSGKVFVCLFDGV